VSQLHLTRKALTKQKQPNMAKYRITTKHLRTTNGVRIEPGMSVEVITLTIGNPVVNNGGTLVQQAFLRIYGVDIKKAGCLNMGELSVEQI
jgi:hypothetical protein